MKLETKKDVPDDMQCQHGNRAQSFLHRELVADPCLQHLTTTTLLTIWPQQ